MRFEAGYNATCSQFETMTRQQSAAVVAANSVYGNKLLSNELVDSAKQTVASPAHAPTSPPLSTLMILHGINGGIPSSYETVASLSIEQMRSLVFEVAKGKFESARSQWRDMEEEKVNGATAITTQANGHHALHAARFDPDSALSPNVVSAARSILSTHSPDSAFCLVDISQLIRRFYQWTQTFKRIEPVYVVPASGLASGIALVLAHLGCSFACQSAASLQSLLGTGIPSSRLLFDLAWKSQQQLRFARSQHVDLLTAASAAELENISKLHDNARILLQLTTSDQAGGVGVQPDQIQPLLLLAKSSTSL